jgi:lysylphosphatidylglycerol synthetase-like protein (DUF2156 family)
MADTRDEEDRLREEEDKLWEVRSKGMNYLVIAYGAAFVACLTLVKDIDNTPKLKGLGPVIILLGVGLMSAIFGLANLYSWRQAQLRGRQEQLWPQRKLFYLAACPVILSLVLLLVVIIVAMVKFGNL